MMLEVLARAGLVNHGKALCVYLESMDALESCCWFGSEMTGFSV
jgi:hypothetical protein